MRLIAQFPSPKAAYPLSCYLRHIGIENFVESEQSGKGLLWVVNEDDRLVAKEWADKFIQNSACLPKIPPSAPPVSLKANHADTPKPGRVKKPAAVRGVSFLLLMLCSCLYLMQTITSLKEPALNNSQYRFSFIASSPLQNSLLYDFPKAYELLQKLYTLYTPDEIQNPNQVVGLNPLLEKIQNTPFFSGFYPMLIAAWKKEPPPPSGPLFEKLREGQVWRVFTPCLLHADFLHLFFNMTWLFVLGPQMEQRLKPFRFALFVLLAACFSNTLQYLVSGPNFLGFSGVVCAMVGFIWMRQKKAAWEGYLLQRSTIVFVGLFVLAMLGLQVFSTFLEISNLAIFPISIANTAHISGGLLGIFCGSRNWFAYNK